MIIPTFRSYGDYQSGNYGVHALEFSLPNGISFYYSYSTLVAFTSPYSGRIVMRNYWSTTTGKHLNLIDRGDKASRLDTETFNSKLADMLAHYGMSEEANCKVCGESLYGTIRVHHHHRSDCKEAHDCATVSDCKGEGR